MPAVVTLTRLGTDRLCRRRKRLQLSACALAVSFCAVTLAGCERIWHSSEVAGTGSARGASSIANGHKSSNPANTHSVSGGANAYAASTTANASIATRPRLGTPIPLPEPALLSPQPEPDCEFKTSESKTDASGKVPPEEERMKLDYERQCYRHAEMIVRGRLDLLQSSVDKTINAIKRTDRNGS
jgi:hypothetical protein